MHGLADDDKPPLLSRRASPGIKIVAVAIVSITLMMLDSGHERLAPVRGSLAVALQPLQIAAEIPGDVFDYLGRYFDRGGLIARNDALSHKVLLLRGRLQKLAALKAENERIRALLASSESIEQDVLIAEILSVSPNPYRHYVMLNKGAADGVFVGQALIDANGIMGQITDVTPFGSRAILITDVNHAIPVEINRTGLRTVAEGTGTSGELRLPFLPNSADVRPGDLLVSSGLGGVYPAGYPVATVTRVSREPGDEFLDVAATPTARLKRGRDVLLVWTRRSDQAAATLPPETRAQPEQTQSDQIQSDQIQSDDTGGGASAATDGNSVQSADS